MLVQAAKQSQEALPSYAMHPDPLETEGLSLTALPALSEIISS